MHHARVNAAKFIGRVLADPYETTLGGDDPEATHHLLACAHADRVCPPTGHSISWQDCYDTADQRPLPHKAGFLQDQGGSPLPLPDYLTGAEAERFLRATRAAVRIRQAARSMPLGNQG